MKALKVGFISLLLLLLHSTIFADSNTKTGENALGALTTGVANTADGAEAGRAATTSRGSLYLGYGAGVDNNSSWQLFINTMFYPSNGIFGDFSTGYFGVNKTSPTVALDVTGSVAVSGALAVTGAYTGLASVVAITTNTTLTAAQSGSFLYVTALSEKKTITLPAAAAGINFRYYISDSDSARFTTASGDSIRSLIPYDYAKSYKTIAATRSTGGFMAVDGTYYTPMPSVGDNRSY